MFAWLQNVLDQRILRHFRESRSPVQELALASAVGIFWALTPLIGIQMLLVGAAWALLRPLGFRFQPAIAMAWVWLTNPITMPPFYYGFYITGYWIFRAAGAEMQAVGFDAFREVLQQSLQMGVADGLLFWLKYMATELGWPMLAGGFAIGAPCAALGYPLTIALVNRFRRSAAARLGLSLTQWEDRFVFHRHPDISLSVEESAVIWPAAETGVAARTLPKTKKRTRGQQATPAQPKSRAGAKAAAKSSRGKGRSRGAA
ncbi:MAG: DUF2062 domain-containing protein [Leptospirales bacterium]|nr:DUF2062 domain-containing protein [Leptospirales bacterium]